jgi:hypothetical protein
MSFNHQNNNGITLLTNSMIRREGEYRKGIDENRTMVNSLASRLARNGKFDNLLDDDSMNEFRTSLKMLAEGNIANERFLTAYLGAVTSIGNSGNQEMDNFQGLLEQTVEQELKKVNDQSPPLTEEPRYLELCMKLGEIDEDEDLAVLPQENASSLKCPIKGTLMEDPVKSTVCGHSYSREGIEQHIKNSNVHTSCPMYGCRNNRLNWDQLVDDPETAMLVRREKKRQVYAKKSQSQSQAAIDMDDDEEEEATFR